MEPLPRPRAAWWVYEAYGSMNGTSLAAEQRSRQDVDALGAFDCRRAVFALGYFPSGSLGPREMLDEAAWPANASVAVALHRLPQCLRPRMAVRVLIEYVPRAGRDGELMQLESTAVVANVRLPVQGDGSVVLPPVELEPMSAAKLTLEAVV